MINNGHHSPRDDVGAYLLGALPDADREQFELHLAGCEECRAELERLRPAADLLPRSVEQVEPPESLKRSLMAVVEEEATEPHAAGRARPRRARPSVGARLARLFGPVRPALVAATLAIGLLIGVGIASLGGSDTHTISASVDRSMAAAASARLQLEGDGKDGAILRVRGMPQIRRGVYQAWVEHDGMVTPQPTFDVGQDGGGAVAVPDDLSGASAVLVTREPPGGSLAPSGKPLLTVEL